MKIGIIEIMDKGHFTLVCSLIQIYLSNTDNEIYIFTHQTGYDIIQPTIKNSERVFIIKKQQNETVSDFFVKINNFDLNKLYIVTLDAFFIQIKRIKNDIPLYLFVHNNENWFLLSPKILLYRFFVNFARTKKLIYSFKVCFVHPFYREIIKKQIIQSGGKFVVLNKIIKKNLALYVDENKIEVIPFSVYEPKENITEESNSVLKICIPGIVDESRRDYDSIFKIIENDLPFFSGKIEIELLGGIINIEKNNVLKAAKELIKKGVSIKYHPVSYIPMFEYDESLAKADIILGNFYTVLNKYCKYGETKDTGVVYTMIKVAKPGILPDEYAIMDEIKSSTLTYKSYDDLKSIFKRLIIDKNQLIKLKDEAKKNSQYFLPENIYKSL